MSRYSTFFLLLSLYSISTSVRINRRADPVDYNNFSFDDIEEVEEIPLEGNDANASEQNNDNSDFDANNFSFSRIEEVEEIPLGDNDANDINFDNIEEVEEIPINGNAPNDEEANGGWKDFYAYNRGGHWLLSTVLMTSGCFVAAILTAVIHNIVLKKQKKH